MRGGYYMVEEKEEEQVEENRKYHIIITRLVLVGLPDTSGVFEACNYVMLFLCYTLYFNSVLCYF